MIVGERNYNAFFIQIDASNFEEFEISVFEISRVDCIASSYPYAVTSTIK